MITESFAVQPNLSSRFELIATQTVRISGGTLHLRSDWMTILAFGMVAIAFGTKLKSHNPTAPGILSNISFV